MPIKFSSKTATVDKEKIYSIEIYRSSKDNLSYIDSVHPMNIEEIQKLKDYLGELIWKEFNY